MRPQNMKAMNFKFNLLALICEQFGMTCHWSRMMCFDDRHISWLAKNVFSDQL